MPRLCGGDEGPWLGFPDEGPWALLVLLDGILDGRLRVDDGMEDAALKLAAAELGEEALDRHPPEKTSRPLCRSPKETRQ